MKGVTLNINGRNITVPAGSTILEAARQENIHIPSLCYDEELSSARCCCLCIVEVEGAEDFVLSCDTKVFNGMVVRTDTPEICQVRKTLLELLLANHPKDCMVCDRAGVCQLQNYAYWYRADYDFFEGERYRFNPDESSPFIYRDLNKCILCGKCIRVCRTVIGREALNFDINTLESRIVASSGEPLVKESCVHCGNCVAVCPVGALIERKMIGRGRPWDLKKVTTICPYCGVGCTLDLNIKDGKVVGVTSNPHGKVNGRYLCSKGRFGYDFIHHPERLTSPYIRREGKLVKVTWQEALEYAAGKLGQIRDLHGGSSLGMLCSARCTNEENYLAAKFARVVLQTNNIDNCARLCHSPTLVGLGKAFGCGAMTNSIDEIAGTRLIMAVGSNITETHPVIALKIRQALSRGATLVVVDPRHTELADLAHYYLQIKPGTDTALLNAMAHVIIAEDLWNRDFVWERTEDFHSMRLAVKRCTPEWAEEITGISAERIREVDRKYALSETGMIIYTVGVTQHSHGTNNVLAIANLALLTGKIGREFCGVNPLRGQNNVQGACDMGVLPDYLAGYQSIADRSAREIFELEWQCRLPADAGLTEGEMLEAALNGEVKGMYVIGENPVISEADAAKTKAALEALEFLVVQDIFMTETAELADVVFPACTFAEKDGTYTNTERRVQRVRRAIDPLPDSKPDWLILYELAKAMGYNWRVMYPRDIMKEISRLTPIYGGINYPRVGQGGLQWPCWSLNHPGTKFLYEKEFFRGRAKFHRVDYRTGEEEPDGEYPYVLITGRRLYHYHTGTMTRKVDGLNLLLPEGALQINPEDAMRLKVRDGDTVRVVSRRGEVTAKVQVTKRVPTGVVFASFHFHEVLINELTSSRRDREAKIPELKKCAVRIEKAR